VQCIHNTVEDLIAAFSQRLSTLPPPALDRADSRPGSGCKLRPAASLVPLRFASFFSFPRIQTVALLKTGFLDAYYVSVH
jgi:hypothetical protein